MMQPRWKKFLLTLSMAVLPAAAGGPFWAEYTGEETITFYVGVYKPILWKLIDSDTKDDESTLMYDEREHKFDLDEFVEPNGYPTGVSASVNLFGVVESRISYEWFSFKYDDDDLVFDGSPVDRRDYALDLMLGYDINRYNRWRIAGLMFQLYPYLYGGFGHTDYNEKITVAGRTQTGNIVPADANHINFGTGARFGLAKLVNIGTEFGAKFRDFRTENPPQPSGTATENFVRITVATAYGK